MLRRLAARTRKDCAHRALLLILALLTGCTGACRAPRETRSSCNQEIQAYIFNDQERYERAIESAAAWLDNLRVDPFLLREHGIKGKKKLTELLDAYYRLWRVAEPGDRDRFRARFEDAASVTYQYRYHDMSLIDEARFKEDSTSYLRAALLMERMNLDTQLFRREIRAVHPRLNAHMKRRGPNQRVVFSWYYKHFNLTEPFPLENALDSGLIAARKDHRQFDSVDVYTLTHEIFAPYEYGDRLDVEPFDTADRVYLRATLDALTTRCMERNDPDLVAELLTCMRLLRFVDSPPYLEGLRFLLERQNPDGSWGDLLRARKRYGEFGIHASILHTTMVSLDALTLAFHLEWNRSLSSFCPTEDQRKQAATPG